MSLAKILKKMEFNGKPATILPEEKMAGIEAKLCKLFLPKDYWLCLGDISKMEKDTYQRDRNSKHVKDIDQSWNPLYASVPVCSLRADSPKPAYHGKPTLFIDDGQHTRAVELIKGLGEEIRPGVKVVPCLVHFGLSFQSAALNYHARNDLHMKLETWNKFEAAYFGGSDNHKEVMRLAMKYGLTTPIDQSRDESRPADLMHADRYVKIVRYKGPDFLEKIFKLHANCWKGQSHGITFLKALEQVLYTYDLNVDRATIKAMKSPTIIADLHKAAMHNAAVGCKKPNEPVYRKAIEDRLHEYRIILPEPIPENTLAA